MKRTDARPIIAITSRLGPGNLGGIEAVVSRLVPEIAARRNEWDVRWVYAFKRMTALSRVPFLVDIVSAIRIAIQTRNANVVVVNGGEYAWPRLLSRRTRGTTAVVWHGTRYGEIPALLPHLTLALRIYALLEHVLCKLATYFPRQIAVGNAVVEELRIGYGYEGPVDVVVNGIALLDSFPAVRSANEPLRLLWSGTNPYKKGLDLAMEACRRAQARGVQLRLTVIGVDPAALAAAPWLDVYGLVKPEQAIDYLSESDIYLASTRYEGCSVACLEAMSMGVPVVGTPILSWMVDDGGACSRGYDAAELSELIVRFAADRTELARAGQRARAIAKQFDWGRCADAYVDVIENMLSPKQ